VDCRYHAGYNIGGRDDMANQDDDRPTEHFGNGQVSCLKWAAVIILALVLFAVLGSILGWF